MKTLQITDLNFKKNFYDLALLKHVHSAFLSMENIFGPLLHMIPKIIIALIAPFTTLDKWSQ